jgi:glycosyltransferase involved in cell wall biosynthesis
MAHALERVLDAAEILRKRRDIAFVFAGAGAARGELVRSARERGLENVVFVESRPKEQMPALWSVCDVGLVHLGRDLAFARVIPSKIFECFGMGVPVLFAGPDGEGARIVREHGAGVAVEAENPELLASAIEFLAGDAELRGKFARASRAAAPDFERGQLALSMLAVLERCAGIERTEPSSSTIVDRRPARRSA